MVTFLNPDGLNHFVLQVLPSMSTHSMIPAPTPYDSFSNFIALAIHFSTGAMAIHRQSGKSSSSLRCSLGVSRLISSSSSSMLPLRFNFVFVGTSSCTNCSATSSHCCAKELVPRNCSPKRANYCARNHCSASSIQCCLP